jgi:adenine specific DNA methylase Mod
MNRLYYGDNLEILRKEIKDESVDLIYLDPPFNSNRSYNVLFKSQSGDESQAQIEAFDDSWHWSQQAEQQLADLIGGGAPSKVADAIGAMRHLLGTNDVLAYLVMMTTRLIELHRVLKPTGSLYLHCDPTASHYLKVVLDAIFGPEQFRNEIVWKRTAAKGSPMGRLPSNHDIILSYAKTASATWNELVLPYDLAAPDAKTLTKYTSVDSDGRVTALVLSFIQSKADDRISSTRSWASRRLGGGPKTEWTKPFAMEEWCRPLLGESHNPGFT